VSTNLTATCSYVYPIIGKYLPIQAPSQAMSPPVSPVYNHPLCHLCQPELQVQSQQPTIKLSTKLQFMLSQTTFHTATWQDDT
jgi:hypothetical protein